MLHLNAKYDWFPRGLVGIPPFPESENEFNCIAVSDDTTNTGSPERTEGSTGDKYKAESHFSSDQHPDFSHLKKNAECPNTHQYFFNFKITVTDNTGCGLHRQQTDKHYDPDTAA